MSTNLTFFVWADTHYGYNQRLGDEDQRARAVGQMNSLPGWPYPEFVGGVVDEPEFVLLCGDAVDGSEGAGEMELGCFHHYTRRLRFPQLEVMGNHDQDPAYAAYFRGRYGGMSHSFDRQGIHFVCLNSLYSGGEHFSEEELAFLRDDLAAVGDPIPVILFVHCRLDRFVNGGDVLDILVDHRVILVVSAHVHKPAVFQLRGIDCVDVGQCRDHPIDPEYGRNLYVMHVTDGVLTAVPWRWDLADWERGQRWADPASTARRFTLKKTL
jgi:hypothetical protein